MHNSPLSRFQVRLRKIIWLFPPAAVAGAMMLERGGRLAHAVAAWKYMPGVLGILFIMLHTLFPIVWVCLTIPCARRVAVRITRARKVPQSHRDDATLILGFLVFFCQVLVSAIIIITAGKL